MIFEALNDYISPDTYITYGLYRFLLKTQEGKLVEINKGGSQTRPLQAAISEELMSSSLFFPPRHHG